MNIYDMEHAKCYLQTVKNADRVTLNYLATPVGEHEMTVTTLSQEQIRLAALRTNASADDRRMRSNVKDCKNFIYEESERMLHDTPLIEASNMMPDTFTVRKL